MNLLNLISWLVDPRSRPTFLQDHYVDTASEHLSVYMRGAPGLGTEIALLGVEETDEVMDYHKDGTHWVNFLPLYMVEEWVAGGIAAHKSPEEIAARVLEYAQNDA